MGASDLLSMMQRLVTDHSRENDALHDLYTWLPSYAAAKKHFGDYASEVCFDRKDVIVEATMVLCVLTTAISGDMELEKILAWFYVSDETLADADKEIPTDEEKLDFIVGFFRDNFNYHLAPKTREA